MKVVYELDFGNTTNNYRLDSEDDFCLGCANFSHYYQKQAFPGVIMFGVPVKSFRGP